MIASALLTNIIGWSVAILVIGLAITYIVVQKKRGNKCIGCPHVKSCTSCHGKKKKDSHNEPKNDKSEK